jgi:hypothetical protein
VDTYKFHAADRMSDPTDKRCAELRELQADVAGEKVNSSVSVAKAQCNRYQPPYSLQKEHCSYGAF